MSYPYQTYLIGISIIVVCVLAMLVTSENFPIGTLPPTTCIPTTITVSPTLPAAPTDTNMQNLLNTVDPSVATAYKNAYNGYNDAFNAYNRNPKCSDTACIGGTVDNSGNCICTNGTPYIYNGKIYCVPIDLSADPNSVFDPTNSVFKCKDGYSQTNPDSMVCYHTANTSTIRSYIDQLNQAKTSISNMSSKIMGAYGKVNNFYVAGQAALPTSGLTQITTGGVVNNVADTSTCVKNAPSTATFFSYNPQTKTCTYYTGNVSLSSLAIGSLTIGSTSL